MSCGIEGGSHQQVEGPVGVDPVVGELGHAVGLVQQVVRVLPRVSRDLHPPMFRRERGTVEILLEAVVGHHRCVDHHDEVFPRPGVRGAVRVRHGQSDVVRTFLVKCHPRFRPFNRQNSAAAKRPVVRRAVASHHRHRAEMNGVLLAWTGEVDVCSVCHEPCKHVGRCVERCLVHATGACRPNVPAAVIGLQKGVDVDHGQALVVQDPVVEVCVPVINGIGRADVDAAVGPALVGQTHHALRRDGRGRPVLPRVPSVFRAKNFVSCLGPRQHTPQQAGVGAVDVEVNRPVAVVAVFRVGGARRLPRCSAVRRRVDAPQGAVHLLRHVDAVTVTGADLHGNDLFSSKVVHQHPRRPSILGAPQF